MNRQVFRMDSDGVQLTDFFLNEIENGASNVILVEGAKETELPIILEIRNKGDSQVVARFEFPVKISGVEDMFQMLSLIDKVGYGLNGTFDIPDENDTRGRWTRWLEPSNWPDSLTNGDTFLHVHGFTVTQQKARAEHSVAFKRFFHAGLESRFVGVNWRADTGADYYQAVVNALLTSKVLKTELQSNGLLNGDVTAMAHSLGNMLVSNAIERHLFRPNKYIIVNGAVPIEAYSEGPVTDAQESDMVVDAWQSYFNDPFEKKFLASHWHELFEDNNISDNRRYLTWGNFFKNVKNETDVYNFYSTGESVVENPGRIALNPASLTYNIVNLRLQNWWSIEDTGRSAWVAQEASKGNELLEPFMWAQHAGWDLASPSSVQNGKYTYILPPPLNTPGMRPSGDPILVTITEEELRIEPFFKKFESSDKEHPFSNTRFSEYDGDELYGSLGNSIASTQTGEPNVLYKLLSECFPSKSYAVAANEVIDFEIGPNQRNFDLNSELKQSGWISRSSILGGSVFASDWWHSDIWNVSYVYTKDAFVKIDEILDL